MGFTAVGVSPTGLQVTAVISADGDADAATAAAPSRDDAISIAQVVRSLGQVG